MLEKRIICQKCEHYFVTWQSNQPHGCNAYGFKSKTIPSVVVKNSSGKQCHFFNLKQKNN